MWNVVFFKKLILIAQFTGVGMNCEVSVGRGLTFWVFVVESWSMSHALDTSSQSCFESPDTGLGLAWQLALEEYPAFGDLSVREDEASDRSYFSADDLEIVLATDHRMSERTVAAAAELLGLAVEEITPEIFRVYVFAHELGHAHHYFEEHHHLSNGAKVHHGKRLEEITTLPVPRIRPSILRERVEFFYDIHRSRLYWLNITLEALPDAQTAAYRNLPTERYADQFAADFMLRHGLVSAS